MCHAMANKRLVKTPKARRNFGVCARYQGFAGMFGLALPVMALLGLHNRGVSDLIGRHRSNYHEDTNSFSKEVINETSHDEFTGIHT